MMSDDPFIAINSEKPNKKGKMLKHLFWSTVKIKSKFVSHELSEKPPNHCRQTPGWPPHSSLNQFHAEIHSRNDIKNTAVGFNTKSTKPYKKTIYPILLWCVSASTWSGFRSGPQSEMWKDRVPSEKGTNFHHQNKTNIPPSSFNPPHCFLHCYHKKDRKYGVILKKQMYY